MKVATATTASFTSMLPPMEREISSAARASSGGPRLGNPEGAAIDRRDVEDFAGLAGCAARDLRVPERVAVFHARGRDRPPVPMHPDDAGDGDGRGGDRLPYERAARIPDPRRHQRRDTEHEQVKRAAHQLGDDEDEAGDQPGKGNVHGTKTGGFLCRLCYLICAAG